MIQQQTINDSNDDATERDLILDILGERIRATETRVKELGTDEQVDEDLLIRWTRTLGYLAGQYRKLMKDTDIDRMEAEVESLAEELEVDV